MRQHARHHRPHDVTAAGVEGHGVVQLERKQVERIVGEDLLPVEARLENVAGRPCFERLHMQAFPGRDRREIGPDLIERLLDLRQDGPVLQHQQKVAAEALRQDEGGIVLERGLDLR